VIGQAQQQITQFQRQHAKQQPATKYMGDAGRPTRQQIGQEPQDKQMHRDHRSPAQPAEISRRVIKRVPGMNQDQTRHRRQQAAQHRKLAPASTQGK